MTPLLAEVLKGLAMSFVGGLGGTLLYKVCRGRDAGPLRPLRRPWAKPRRRPSAGEDPADLFRGVVGYRRAGGLGEEEAVEAAREMMREMGYEERHAEGGGTAWGPSAPNLEVSKHA